MRPALFIPCYIEHLRPAVGLAIARLLDRLGLDWHYPADQTCCGQPAYNAGHPSEVLPAARHFLRRFGEAEQVVSPSGSCVAMLRRYAELPGLSAGEQADFAALAPRCHELSDFIVNVLGRVDLGARWPGRVAFQDGCHALRELGIAEAPRRLLAAVAGLELVDAAGPEHECCGFGGVFAVKLPELSAAMADVRLDALAAAGTDTLVLTDVSCLLQLEGRARRRGLPFRGLHLAEILAETGGVTP
jgi:L-lactate dehydrogenase complex protein LldE